MKAVLKSQLVDIIRRVIIRIGSRVAPSLLRQRSLLSGGLAGGDLWLFQSFDPLLYAAFLGYFVNKVCGRRRSGEASQWIQRVVNVAFFGRDLTT